jgi:hypothetical protein
MSRLKTILLLSGLFIISTISAFYFELNYRSFVRFFFKFFNGDKITFVGKNFHLFASWYFVIAFGLFCVIFIALIFQQNKSSRFIKIGLTILIFVATTMITSYIDSSSKIAECTVCSDGKRILNYNSINYDIHFILSLVISLLPLIISTVTKRKIKN